VIFSPLFRQAALPVFAVLAMSSSAFPAARAQAPSTYSRTTVSGNYLAARHAGIERDATAASAYYRAALRGDSANTDLLNRTFLAVLANGDIDEASKLADRVLKADKTDRVARLVLGVTHTAHPVGARTDYRPRRHAVDGVELFRPEREQSRDRRDR
jgi:hypothetical protein